MKSGVSKPNVARKSDVSKPMDLTITGISSLVSEPLQPKQSLTKTNAVNTNSLKQKKSITNSSKQVSFQCFDEPRNENCETRTYEKKAQFNKK